MNLALASTVKLLKTVTSVRFANRRTLTIGADASWLAKSKLTPTDRRQLAGILGAYSIKPPITLDRALVTAPAELFTGELEGIAAHPVECHDIFDQADVVQFQLWLYFGDRGLLLKAATSTAVAQVHRGAFDFSDRGLDVVTGERLAALLRKAKKVAAALHPTSELAKTAF